MKWTQFEEDKIREMIKSNKTYKDISNSINRSESSIRNKLRNLNLKYTDFSKIEKICKLCSRVFVISVGDSQQIRRVYCGRKCSIISSNFSRRRIRNCLDCNLEILGSGKKFCNHSCMKNYMYLSYIKRWKEGLEDGIAGKLGTSTNIRKYLFQKYKNQCSKCGWCEINKKSGNSPLNLEHIDGNWKNNKEENLDLLCPNCHSLTNTYGALNRGFGRKNRH